MGRPQTVLGRWLIAPLALATLALVMGKAEASEQSDDPKWCRVCHTEARFSAREMSRTVHAEMVCRDCHLTRHFNPHEAPGEDPEEAETVAAFAKRDAVALSVCSECHDDVLPEGGKLGHGDSVNEARSGKEAKKAGGRPYCLECHGDPHTIIAMAKMSGGERRRQMNERCITCHADQSRMAKAGLGTRAPHSYEDSMHGRKLHLGSDSAPGCYDCHGSHSLRNLAAGRAQACTGCHESATEDFAGIGAHLPLTPEDRPAGYYTQKFFAWLTFLTIFFLALHVLLDLFSSIRTAARSNDGKAG